MWWIEKFASQVSGLSADLQQQLAEKVQIVEGWKRWQEDRPLIQFSGSYLNN